MKKLFLLNIVFLVASCANAQNITGNWVWQSENGDHKFEMSLEKPNTNTIKGYHCGIFRQGQKIDCVESNNDYSINLTKYQSNVYKGSIRSGFSGEEGTIKITYNSSHDTIFFERLEYPNGESYIPNKITLTRR